MEVWRGGIYGHGLRAPAKELKEGEWEAWVVRNVVNGRQLGGPLQRPPPAKIALDRGARLKVFLKFSARGAPPAKCWPASSRDLLAASARGMWLMYSGSRRVWGYIPELGYPREEFLAVDSLPNQLTGINVRGSVVGRIIVSPRVD